MNTLGALKQDLSFPFVAPALILMAFVTLVPLGFVLYFGLTRDGQFTASGLTDTVTSALFFRVLVNTIVISVTTAVVATLLAYPVALHIAAQPPHLRNLYVMIIMLPFWTSILVKSFSFAVLLGRYGLINNSFREIFGETVYFSLLYNRFGVIVGLVSQVLPFIVMPLLSNILSQDPNLAKAARSMGAGSAHILFRITIPLSLKAAAAGALLAVVLVFGSFITPALLGGPGDITLANLIDFFVHETLDWNRASAIAIMLLLISTVLMLGLRKIGAGAKN